MRLAAVRAADLVRCDRLGRRFWARVEGRDGRTLAITPVTRNINYYNVTGRDVLEHFAHRPRRAGKVSTRSVRPQDIVIYQQDGATVHAIVMTRHRARLRVLPIAPVGQVREVLTREITDHYARRCRLRQ